MTDPWLVVVCAGRWQLGGIRAAKRLGLRVLALDGSADAPGLELADASCVVDIRRPDDVLAAVQATGIEILGASTFTAEAGMASVAALRATFGGSGPDADGTLRLIDKGLQRAAWDRAGIPNPTWTCVTDPVEGSAALARATAWSVVKPADGAGSRGVTVTTGEAQGEDALARAFAISKNGRVMVEDFVPGTEHTVECFGDGVRQHVLAVTVKRKAPGSLTVADELATLPLESKVARRIGSLAGEALAALGHLAGPGHVEVILADDGRAVLVEAAGRGGGFGVFDYLVPLASGFDIAAATALSAIGRRPIVARRSSDVQVVLRFSPSKAGRIDSITVGSSLPHGSHVEPLMEVGAVTGDAAADGDRNALILGHGATMEAAEVAADVAEQGLQITYTQGG